jgi:hypothetical protein
MRTELDVLWSCGSGRNSGRRVSNAGSLASLVEAHVGLVLVSFTLPQSLRACFYCATLVGNKASGEGYAGDALDTERPI